MKPLNLDNRPCSPISSNCVIWQGPDIPCIKLCTGDTISDVVFKLATELCAIMDTLKITNYDLSCFNLGVCPPQDFQELIQLLIDKICELEGVTPTTGRSVSSTCPDCVVNVASCFVVGNQTTMQLVDYVNMIGQKICSLISEIIDIQNQINNIDIRVTALENATPPTFTLPSIATNCLQPYIAGSPASTTIDLVLNALVNNSTLGYCALIGATGEPSEISAAVLSQCITDLDQPLAALPAVTTFSAYYAGTWVLGGDLTTAADAINNLWIALCDMRNYVLNGSQTVVDAGDGITVTSAVVGNTTTYTVSNDYLETFVATTLINNTRQPINGSINKVLPAVVEGLVDGQIMYKFNSVAVNNTVVTAAATPAAWVANGSIPACSFGSFDNDATGTFSISKAGTYLINATVQLKPDNGSSVYWQTTGQGFGTVGIGILASGKNIYSGNYETLVEDMHRQISVTASVTAYLAVGDVVRMSVLNMTDRDYNGNVYTSGDVMRFSITKLK